MFVSKIFNITDLTKNLKPSRIEEVRGSSSDSSVLESVESLVSHTNETVLELILRLVKDNPYTIFLFIVVAVLAFTIALRMLLTSTSFRKNLSFHGIIKKLWRILLSSNFLWIGFLVGVILGTDSLKLNPSVVRFFDNICLSFILLILHFSIKRVLVLYERTILMFWKNKDRQQWGFRTQSSFLVFMRFFYGLWIFAFLTILLGIWGVKIGPILAGLGIAGVVVGLALQDTLSHILGGIFLMLDGACNEGDYVVLDEKNEGIVFHVGYRSTKIRTFNDEIIVVPNGLLSKMIIRNLSQPIERIRITKKYCISATDKMPEQIKHIMLESLKDIPVVLTYPVPYIFFLGPSGTQYEFSLNFYISSPIDKLSCADIVQQKLVTVFRENNIHFAPTESVVHLK